jgi:copper chaperone NosL
VGFAFFSLYDFWKWEYEFGHNLSPDAPIKMEDMVYQPPLIGSKDFLNIQASSWPEIAGLAFAVSVFLAVVVFIISIKSTRKTAEAG